MVIVLEDYNLINLGFISFSVEVKLSDSFIIITGSLNPFIVMLHILDLDGEIIG